MRPFLRMPSKSSNLFLILFILTWPNSIFRAFFNLWVLKVRYKIVYFIFFRDLCGINIQIRVSMILTYKRVASRNNIQRTCSIIFRTIIFKFIWVTFEQKINNTMIFFISMRVRFHIGVYGRVARAGNIVYVGTLIMAKSLIIVIDWYTIIFGAMFLFVTLFFTQMTDHWRYPAEVSILWFPSPQK